MSDDVRTATALGRTLSWRALDVRTPDGLAISAQDWGEAGRGRDVLLIHGYSQTHLSWVKQVTGPLGRAHRLVTYDLRGHGGSEKPYDPAYYQDGVRWAGEVQAVIDAAGLVRPVLVAHSYAGRIALDYLRSAPEAAVAGVVMVSAVCKLDRTVLGPGVTALTGMASPDLAARIEATRRFIALSVARPLPRDEHELMLAFNMLGPAASRAAMKRPAEYDDVLARLRLPVLAIQGLADQVVLPAMTEHLLALCPSARALWYEGVGHSPFWEIPERFDADVAAFIAELE